MQRLCLNRRSSQCTGYRIWRRRTYQDQCLNAIQGDPLRPPIRFQTYDQPPPIDGFNVAPYRIQLSPRP